MQDIDYEAIAQRRRTQSEPRTLACPYCGGSLTIESRIDTCRMDVEITVECDSFSCGAEFDNAGACTRTPAQYQGEIDAMARKWPTEN